MNVNEEIGKRIRLLRRMIGITRADLSAKYDIEYSTFSLWETGKVKITDKIIYQCIQIFLQEGIDSTFNWIKNNEGPEPVIEKPTRNTSIESKFYKKDNITPEIQFFLDVQAYKKNNKQSIIHQIKNKAMSPFFNIGDIVGGAPIKEEDYYKANSKICIVSVAENKYIVRYFYKKKTKYILTAENTSADVINPFVLESPPLLLAPINFFRKSPLDDF